MQKKLSLLFLFFTVAWLGSTQAQTDESNQTDPVAVKDSTIEDNIIPIITLNDSDLSNDQDEGVFGLLSASKDVFVRITDFNLQAARFRFRGYDSENTALYYNNIPMNDLESGWAGWSSWSGLNDMTRRQETNTGLEATDYSFGAVGGAINLDTRASSQRRQIRLTLTQTNNGNYNNRVMLSGATGMQENGWAFAAMASRRWAEEAYLPGTFHDGYSYFLSVDKKLGDNDLLNFQIVGAPSVRGKAGAAVQELYDIADDNYYNPYWGFQNGEKRNSRVATRHQPMAVLRWDKKFSDKISLTTAVNYQTGRNGSTSLDWQGAPDPRPDYYRRLPSYTLLQDQSQIDEALYIESLLSSDESLRQVDWDAMYEINSHNFETIEDANGLLGNSISGNRAHYVVLERRYDSNRINFNTNITAEISNDFTVSGGLSAQDYRIENYQIIDDLLGSDYFLDIDRFADRDFQIEAANLISDPILQNDLNNPIRVIYEGERYGYDYTSNIQKSTAWTQGEWTKGALGFFVAAELNRTQFWRTGNFRNGRFPDNSFGDSEKQHFLNYGLKGGFNYGINGRNYLVGNVAYQTRAPYFRNAYTSPRTRDDLISNLTDTKITSVEGAYLLKAPGRKVKIGGYYTLFNDQIDLIRFYNDLQNTFGSYIMTNVDQRNAGLEVGFEVDVPFISGLGVQGAGNFGQYIYTSRFNAQVIQDNNAAIVDEGIVYAKNYRVSGRPQTAGTIGLRYATANYLTLNVDFNYFDNIWMDFNPERRRDIGLYSLPNEDGFGGVWEVDLQPNTDDWNQVADQEKAESAYTLNVSLRKSFRIKRDYFININIGVDNILNNTDFIRDGYEQLRYDYEFKEPGDFPTRYFYARGITYFVNVAFSFRP